MSWPIRVRILAEHLCVADKVIEPPDGAGTMLVEREQPAPEEPGIYLPVSELGAWESGPGIIPQFLQRTTDGRWRRSAGWTQCEEPTGPVVRVEVRS